jgi:cell division protein FtsB
MPYNINLMKKSRSEDEFKALEQEVQRLKEENLTLKDTVAILKQQCLEERLAKDVKSRFNSVMPKILHKTPKGHKRGSEER